MRLNQILPSSPTSSFQTHLTIPALSLTSSKYSRQFFAVLRISSLSATALPPLLWFSKNQKLGVSRRAHLRLKNRYGNQLDKITRLLMPINIIIRLLMIFSLANPKYFVNRKIQHSVLDFSGLSFLIFTQFLTSPWILTHYA